MSPNTEVFLCIPRLLKKSKLLSAQGIEGGSWPCLLCHGGRNDCGCSLNHYFSRLLAWFIEPIVFCVLHTFFNKLGRVFRLWKERWFFWVNGRCQSLGGKDDPQSSDKQMAKGQGPPETRKWLGEQASCVFSSGQFKKKKKLLVLIILLDTVNLNHFLSFLLKMLYFYSLWVLLHLLFLYRGPGF